MKWLTSLALFVVAVTSACKRQEDKAPAAPSAAAGSSAEGSAAPVAGDSADHVVVLAHHKKPKPTDPVRVELDRFRVVKADFDPKKIEGGTATIELDLSSLHTQSDERDEHLKSPAYLDVGTFATATIVIDHVKQRAGSAYTADATVTVHGTTHSYPVTFDVIETRDDSIRIKGEHTFMRLDFGIGTDPTQNADEQVGTDLTIQLVLTLKKT